MRVVGKESIRIQRRSGDSFILVKKDNYQELQAEIVSLQRRLLGMSQLGRNTRPAIGRGSNV